MKWLFYTVLEFIGRLFSFTGRKRNATAKDTQPPDTNYPLW